MPHNLANSERITQNKLIEFFKNPKTLDYTYYGN